MARRTRSRPWVGGPAGRTVYWYDLEGRQRQRTEASRHLAHQRAVDVAEALARGRDWSPEPVRERAVEHPALGEVARAFLPDLVTRSAPNTVRSYARALDEWLTWLGHQAGEPSSEALSLSMLQDYRAHLLHAPGRHGRARNPRTVQKLVEPVQLFWSWADASGRWEALPRPRELPPLRRVAPMRRAASWWQVDRMLGGLRAVEAYQVARAPVGVAPDWTLRLALLARYTGGRRLELLQVRPTDLNLAAGELWLRPETTKGQYGGRVIPLHPALAALAAGWREGPTLVQAPALELTGRGHADRNVRRAWERSGASEAVWAGQPLHSMRRTMRTHLVRVGVHRDVVDLLLGHAHQGTGGRVYTDVQALWPAMRRAIHTVPAEGLATEEEPWGCG